MKSQTRKLPAAVFPSSDLPPADPFDLDLARFIISWVPFDEVSRDELMSRFGLDLDEALRIVLVLVHETTACRVTCDDHDLVNSLRMHRTRFTMMRLAVRTNLTWQ